MSDYRQHAKPFNFGSPRIDFALVHFLVLARRAGLLPEAVRTMSKAWGSSDGA